MRVAIFSEDAFGPRFFVRLFDRLHQWRVIRQGTYLAKTGKYPKCNPKLGRMVGAALSSFDRVVVVVDAEGQDEDMTERRTKSHVRRQDLAETRIVVLPYEIEEWICASMNLPLHGSKPSEILRSRRQYEKYQLPTYAERLDLRRLKRLPSFRKFLIALA